MNNATTRMELNIPKGTAPSELVGVGNFVSKHSIPAIVSDPEYTQNLMLERLATAGRHKIICAVDFDVGRRNALDKFRPLPKTVLECDGFDILLTPNVNDATARNELRAIFSFIRENISPVKEIRFCLGMHRNAAQVLNYVSMFKDFKPNFIRTDSTPYIDGFTLEQHIADINSIRAIAATPIKICTNVTLEVMEALDNRVAYFDVTLQQAKKIIRDIRVREQQLQDVAKEA